MKEQRRKKKNRKKAKEAFELQKAELSGFMPNALLMQHSDV